MATFDQACDIVLGTEAGFTSNAADPGNWTGGACGKGACRGTKYGISAKAYPDVDIAALTLDDARALYRRDYWQPIAGDALPAALALLVFDAAVNNGVTQAVRWLQEAAGTPGDGQIGPATLAAVKASAAGSGGAALCAEFLALRMNAMARLPTWAMFGLGWARRLCSLPYQSLRMEG